MPSKSHKRLHSYVIPQTLGTTFEQCCEDLGLKFLEQRVYKTFNDGPSISKKQTERTIHDPRPDDPVFWAGGIPEGITIRNNEHLLYIN